MTGNSNAITDILVKAITDFVIMESKGTADTENVKARIETAAEALYEAVVECVPQPMIRGNAPSRMADEVVRVHNASRAAILTNLAQLFGISKEGEEDGKS